MIYMATFKDFSVEGLTTKRDFREERKCGELYRTIFIFLCSLDLVPCMQFQHDFHSFSDKKGLLFTREDKTLSGGGRGSPVYMFKKALAIYSIEHISLTTKYKSVFYICMQSN